MTEAADILDRAADAALAIAAAGAVAVICPR